MSNTPRVAIVGGGYSGVMTLANIVAQAEFPLEIEMLESAGARLGLGVAYGTKDTHHYLNVRASRMGAFAGKPEGFAEWLESDDGKAQTARICPEEKIDADCFAPRALYGAYLQYIMREAHALAQQKGIRIRASRATAFDASLHEHDTQQLMLWVDRGFMCEEMTVDALVLATGNLSPRQPPFQSGLVRGAEHYVPDIWQSPAGHLFPHRVNELPTDTEIVIIGTGLTMVDAVLTLKSRGYLGNITAISRNGLLPQPHAHADAYPKWDWVENPGDAPNHIYDMLRRLRQEVRAAASKGYDWRAVIDSLRPVTPQLWERLSVAEKRKFLRKLFTMWNVHRHRMSPEIHATLRELKEKGQLHVRAGKIYYIGSGSDGLTVIYRPRGADQVEMIRARLVLNCTGPEYDVAASDHVLLKNMRDRELVTIGPLRAGIELTPQGTAKGRAHHAIFPIGTLMVGELFECTAVPELREHANRVAKKVIKKFGVKKP